jgi:hypothetical protein
MGLLLTVEEIDGGVNVERAQSRAQAWLDI